MARTISKGLAPILERLELGRPQVVTPRDIEKICAEKSAATEPRIVAARLKNAGWLLPTGVRGTWEFAPAELAGAFPSYDPLLPVKAKGTLSLAHEAVLVQMAERPSSVRSWSSAEEWLPHVMAEMTVDATLEELRDKSTATVQRTGYLLQGARPDIADTIFKARPPRSIAHFGQGATLRSCAKWMIADATLPWDPGRLKPLLCP